MRELVKMSWRAIREAPKEVMRKPSLGRQDIMFQKVMNEQRARMTTRPVRTLRKRRHSERKKSLHLVWPHNRICPAKMNAIPMKPWVMPNSGAGAKHAFFGQGREDLHLRGEEWRALPVVSYDYTFLGKQESAESGKAIMSRSY